jgi:hypothetical protein
VAEDVPGVKCGRPTHSHSLCSKHAKRLERNGDLELRRAPNGSKTECAVDGCDRSRSGRDGYCYMHSARVEKSPTGDPGPAGPLARGKDSPPCIDCGNGPGIRVGRCSSCYNRVRDQHTPAELREMGMRATECTEDGCDRTAIATGKCRKHYRSPSEIAKRSTRH